MNWTEGNLIRHSRARQGKGKEVLARQKEHFAKARAKLLSSNVKISPPPISFLAHPVHASPPSCPGSSDIRLPAPSATRKRSQDDRLPQLSRFFADSTVDLPSPSEFQQAQHEEEALRQKRQKLLLKGDWVGTNVQKPIGIKFSKPRASHGNPWGRPHSQLSKQRLRHILGVRTTNAPVRIAEADNRMPRLVSRSQLKIRVGSRERTLGGSSVASPGTRATIYKCSSHARSQDSKCRSDRGRGAMRRENAPPHSYSMSSESSEVSNEEEVTSASRPPPLYQPQPSRPCFPQLLHASSDSDNAGSTTARVGLQKSGISASQLSENEAWREFVAVTVRDHGLSNSEAAGDELECPIQVDISPGASQFGLRIQADESRVETPLELQSEIVDNQEYLGAALETAQTNTLIQVSTGQSNRSERFPGHEELRAQNGGLSERDLKYSTHSDGLPDAVRSVGCNGTPKLPSVPEETACRGEDSKILAASSYPPMTGPQPSTSSCEISEHQDETKNCKTSMSAAIEDENDLWRKFVFGEADENLDEVFDEMRRETVRNLRPFDTSPITKQTNAQGHEADQYADVALALGFFENNVGYNVPVSTANDNITSPLASTTSDFMATASHMAAPAVSSPDPLAAPNMEDFDTIFKTDQATDGSSHSCSTMPEDVLERFLQHGEVCSATTNKKHNALRIGNLSSFGGQRDTDKSTAGELSFIGMEAAALSSKATCRRQSRSHENAEKTMPRPVRQKTSEAAANFIFAKPKLFTGEKLRHFDEKSQIALFAPQFCGKTQSRRRQRRATDGRTRIRSLPNFSSDPIEDFEGDSTEKHDHLPSLFGSLDVEADFDG